MCHKRANDGAESCTHFVPGNIIMFVLVVYYYARGIVISLLKVHTPIML